MNTGTAATRAAASQAWAPILSQAGAQGAELSEQILAVAHQIVVGRLAGPLTDPGRSGDDKAALAQRLFAPLVDVRVVELTQALVRGRWSAPVDLITALHDLGIEAILSGAAASDSVAAVEAELFGVAQTITDNRQLRLALEPSRLTTTAQRVALAQRVFAPALSQPAMNLLVWCVRHRTEGGVPRNLRRVTELAAAMRAHVIADVVTAVPLSRAQQERLEQVLRQRLGREVDLNLVIDPAVMGGVKITVAGQVMDGTVATQLAQLRSALVG